MMKRKIVLTVAAGLWLAHGVSAQEHYDELPNPVQADAAAWASVPGVQVSWGSIYSRYAKEVPPVLDRISVKHRVSAWKGEKVSAQLVVWSGRDIDSLNVSAGEMSSSSGIIPSSAVQSGFVRYVMTDELNKDGRGGCGYRVSRDFDSTLVADCIDHVEKMLPVEKNSTRPVWISVEVPYGAEPGLYSGQVLVRDGASVISSLVLEIDVRDRALPQKRSFHLDLWQNPYAVARYYGVEPFSEEHFSLMRPMMERYAKAGGSAITASIIHKPWNGQTYDPFESMVTWLKKADGTWYYDYTVFDRWVEFMISCGVDGQINCYSMIPWGLSFQYLDQASNSFRKMVAKPGTPEYESFWRGMLRSFAAHLKDKGWFGKTMIAMDERPMDQMLATISVIKDADPCFKVAFAGAYHDELMDWLDYYCVPVSEKYPEGSVERRRAAGKVTTYYTCCSEPWPNTFTFSRPAEAEWLGWFIAANGLDGYLRWALNSWPEKPLLDSRFTAWAAGDTYLLYPGNRTSIRFELLDAGIAAYGKILILKDEFSRTGRTRDMKRLDDMLGRFVIDGECSEEKMEGLLASARKLIERY